MRDDEARQLQAEIIEAAKSLERARWLDDLSDERYAQEAAKVDEWVAEVKKHLGEVEPTLVDLEWAITAGATCEELVDIKVRMKHGPDYDAGSARLKAIGCFSRRSTRTDTPK
ncbi:hypothetical protein IGS73_09415 [Janibacter indicus]|uniref:Uncharacterized protein n=1 Tax=Janibacter indicus TaxID=857417 RepID=A0A7L9IWA1_9MICO|nr:hypothetical protein [Janibacter indicus]QOK21399.1 hypothetical protein IGS73_09415 [Janibacter indicus]